MYLNPGTVKLPCPEYRQTQGVSGNTESRLKIAAKMETMKKNHCVFLTGLKFSEADYNYFKRKEKS